MAAIYHARQLSDHGEQLGFSDLFMDTSTCGPNHEPCCFTSFVPGSVCCWQVQLAASWSNVLLIEESQKILLEKRINQFEKKTSNKTQGTVKQHVKQFTKQPCNQLLHHPNNLTEDHLNLLKFISSQHEHIQPEQWQTWTQAPHGFGCFSSRPSNAEQKLILLFFIVQ